MTFFHRTRTNNSKICIEIQKTQTAKITLSKKKKKNKSGFLMYPHFKTYYKATIAKIIWYWLKNECRDQWNRKENPEMSLHLHGQLIDDE